MANSSSDDSSNSISEVIFQYQSIVTTNNGKKDETSGICPLCLRFQKLFYCCDCIRNGDFTHSKEKFLERFADKKLKVYKLNEEKAKLLEKYHDRLAMKIKAENMKRDISLLTEKNKMLREYVKYNNGELAKDKKLIEDLKSKAQSWSITSSECKEKLQSMLNCVEKYKKDLEDKKALLEDISCNLQMVIQENVQQLVTHIFPITEVLPSKSTRSSAEGQVSELEEAQQTMYVKGHWVVTGSPDNEIQYSIVEPCIPGSGNYSAYPFWTSQHNDTLPLTPEEIHQRDVAYGISAALTFTAQLVLVLTYYLDVQLPKHLCYSEFCGHELKEQQFLHKVAKLNANVIHLCLSQNVNPLLLRPLQTIPNLLLLLDPKLSDLGRLGPVDVNTDIMESMEESLSKDLVLFDDSEYKNDDEEGELSFDWVQIGAEGMPSPTGGYYSSAAEGPSQGKPKYPVSMSLAGELISSLTYAWKTATGQK